MFLVFGVAGRWSIPHIVRSKSFDRMMLRGSRTPKKKQHTKKDTLGVPDTVDHTDWSFGPCSEELPDGALPLFRVKYDNRLANLKAAGVLHLKKSDGSSTDNTQDH